MHLYNISFVGAGRVAGILCRKLFKAGHKIITIVSVNEDNGRDMASSVNADWSSNLSFDKRSDIIIVAVGDNVLHQVLSKIECNVNSCILHTAGSYGVDIFPNVITRKGVLYPVQTFSKGRRLDFKGLPFLIDASDDVTYTIIEELVSSLGGLSYRCDCEHRRLFHLAAVFVCNFTNHMLTSGKKIVEETQLPFSLLEPLVKETVNKAFDCGPENSQTGPAVRNDTNTLNMHKDLLSFDPDLKKIYEALTNSITDNYK